MTASRQQSRLVVLAAALVSVTTMAVAAESWANPAGAGSTSASDGSEQQPFPDWFLPIWDAYDRNPAVTPDFDFAGLYSTELRLESKKRRER
jgi:hypothetical protein